MNILAYITAQDVTFVKQVMPVGHATKILLSTPETKAELVRVKGVDAIVTTNTSLVKLLSGNKAASLDKYAGSVFRLGEVPVLVLPPLEQIHTVTYGKFLLQRYLDKLVAREKFYPPSAFIWEVPTDATAFCKKFKEEAVAIAVDIETTRDNLAITCVGFCAIYKDLSTESIVIPLDSEFNLTFIQNLAALPQPKIMQNGSYDASYFIRYGIELVNYKFDTLHMFHSWYSEMPKSLDFLVAFMLPEFIYWKDESQQAATKLDYYRYNAKDTWATANVFLALLKEMPDWAIANYKIEFPLVFPCIHMALEGLKVDLVERNRIKAVEETRLDKNLQEIQLSLGKPDFNPSSPKQVQQLWAVLGSGDIKTTDVKAMDKVANRHPLNAFFVTAIQDYRKARKLLSSYMDAQLLNGRFMYSFAVAGTDTGRLASRESAFWCGGNIQNMPAGIKSMFIPDTGWLLAEIDKSQSEARCVAYLSGEQKLIDVVESDEDYHKLNASLFFGVPYAEVLYDLRQLAKRVNHGANYNMGAGVMLETMGIMNVLQAKKLLGLPQFFSLKQVTEHLLKIYADTYPAVKGRWYKRILYEIAATGRLKSQLGWTRKCFGKPEKDKRALNAYVAHSPQNLSVSIINKALYKIWKELALTGRIRLVAQIHDSILFQYRAGDDAVVQMVSKLMEVPVSITCSGGIERTMLIPNDVEQGLERWKDAVY